MTATRPPLLLALALTSLFGTVWTMLTWEALSQARLPDTDDMMRLQQVRDWLGGQGWGDLVQHRLGDGVSGSLHWSRLADLGLAGWMLALRPLLGSAADAWAAILWPLTLFGFYLLAAARLAMRLGGRRLATLALIIAAFAYPATTLFLPGRVDHHGLQLILMLLLVERTMAPAGIKSGALAGLVAALSLAIGLETAPMVVAATGIVFVQWVLGGEAERRRLLGFGLALGLSTLVWRALSMPQLWPEAWCDGFTPASFRATLVAAGAAALLGVSRIEDRNRRLLVGALAGGATLAIVWRSSPICLAGPYGATDPMLRALWMDRIEEAKSVLHAPWPTALVAVALPLIGTLAAMRQATATRERRWFVLLAFLLAALAVTFAQVRGSAMATALAVPAVAAMVERAGGRLKTMLAWAVSLGLVWQLVAVRGETRTRQRAELTGCTDARTLAQLRHLPEGTIVAPIDAGPYLLALTPHRVLAAPYHRNNLGNSASYQFWLRPLPASRTIAARWNVRYVLACPDAFGGLDLQRSGPGGVAALLEQGRRPLWLEPIPLRRSEALLFAVRPR